MKHAKTLDSHTQGSISDDCKCVPSQRRPFLIHLPWVDGYHLGSVRPDRALHCRTRQNGLYPIPQGLIEQTSPFLPLSPASPCFRNEEREKGWGTRRKWRQLQTFAYISEFCLTDAELSSVKTSGLQNILVIIFFLCVVMINENNIQR